MKKQEAISSNSLSALVIFIAILVMIYSGSALPLFTFATGEPQTSNNYYYPMAVSTQKDPLPVILIHGYDEDSSVWSEWQSLLQKDGIQFYAVTFNQSDDRCGSSANHAKELEQIVKNVEASTGQNQVNMVAHSKGGLDARVFLSNSSITDVANLIMIGTPNGGGPLASPFDPCSPAVYDFIDDAPATMAPRNLHTQYHTIAGIWNPSLPQNCPQPGWQQFEVNGYFTLSSLGYQLNDGFVPVSSVQSQPYFHSLGNTTDCHRNLFTNQEYVLAAPILRG
jgi:pimeloyl-ACP methyl ester carboxylesterase